MAILTVQQIVKAGITPTFAAATGGGDSYRPSGDGREYIEAVNGSGGSINVTVTAQGPCDTYGASSSSAHSIVVAVPAGERRKIRIPAIGYRDSNGLIQITYSSATSVTVGVFI